MHTVVTASRAKDKYMWMELRTEKTPNTDIQISFQRLWLTGSTQSKLWAKLIDGMVQKFTVSAPMVGTEIHWKWFTKSRFFFFFPLWCTMGPCAYVSANSKMVGKKTQDYSVIVVSFQHPLLTKVALCK